jgi:hypothetical protein
MYGKLFKTMKHFMRKGGFWAGIGDKNMTFLHKVIIALKCCNIMIFIIYIPVLQDTFF